MKMFSLLLQCESFCIPWIQHFNRNLDLMYLLLSFNLNAFNTFIDYFILDTLINQFNQPFSLVSVLNL